MSEIFCVKDLWLRGTFDDRNWGWTAEDGRRSCECVDQEGRYIHHEEKVWVRWTLGGLRKAERALMEAFWWRVQADESC